MQVLKLYAWESSFQDKISEIRAKELVILKKSAYLNAFSTFAWTVAPFMVSPEKDGLPQCFFHLHVDHQK